MHAASSLPRQCSGKRLWESSRVLRFRWARRAPSVIAVDVRGDVDATNAGDFIRYVAQSREPLDDVVLDLRGVTFFGTHGYTALVELIAGVTNPVVLPSPTVKRVLELCDLEHRVPTAADADAAMAMLRRRS